MPRHDHKPRPWAYVAPDKPNWGKAEKKTDPFYLSSRWKHTRVIHLQRHPLCVMCEQMGLITKGEIVDHIVPRSQGGADLDRNNLQTLCKRHHNIKTKQEQNKKTP